MAGKLETVDEKAILSSKEFKPAKPITAQFVKKATSAADLKKAQKDWITSIKVPEAAANPAKPIQGVKLTVAHLDALRAVSESTAATAEIVSQKMTPEQILGVVHSSLATFEYTRLAAEFKKRLADAKDKAAVQAQWQKVVEAAQANHASAGVTGLKEADLDQMAKTLNQKKQNFNAVATIANTAKVVGEADGKKAVGAFVTQSLSIPDLVGVVLSLPADACSKPFIQGSFTKHFGHSFQLQVSLTVWCPTWTNPFRTCRKTFTLAGVSFSVDISVGYKVTCCGATAWGFAATQACATIVGFQVCASCTAGIVGVAGVGRTGSGSSCTYGLGVNAQLKCSLAGITLLNVSAPFGWTLSGPCPPAALHCS